jgi:hypothetical protein
MFIIDKLVSLVRVIKEIVASGKYGERSSIISRFFRQSWPRFHPTTLSQDQLHLFV